jgi:hypothetical protein
VVGNRDRLETVGNDEDRGEVPLEAQRPVLKAEHAEADRFLADPDQMDMAFQRRAWGLWRAEIHVEMDEGRAEIGVDVQGEPVLADQVLPPGVYRFQREAGYAARIGDPGGVAIGPADPDTMDEGRGGFGRAMYESDDGLGRDNRTGICRVAPNLRSNRWLSRSSVLREHIETINKKKA